MWQCVLLFNLRGVEQEAGVQEEGDECSSCNRHNRSKTAPSKEGWPQGLMETHIMLPCRRLIVQISLLLFHASNQKRSEETL